jgi:hypothetical protein
LDYRYNLKYFNAILYSIATMIYLLKTTEEKEVYPFFY